MPITAYGARWRVPLMLSQRKGQQPGVTAPPMPISVETGASELGNVGKKETTTPPQHSSVGARAGKLARERVSWV